MVEFCLPDPRTGLLVTSDRESVNAWGAHRAEAHVDAGFSSGGGDVAEAINGLPIGPLMS
jgi:hypothetical protein